jgi:hypothetical protein
MNGPAARIHGQGSRYQGPAPGIHFFGSFMVAGSWPFHARIFSSASDLTSKKIWFEPFLPDSGGTRTCTEIRLAAGRRNFDNALTRHVDAGQPDTLME